MACNPAAKVIEKVNRDTTGNGVNKKTIRGKIRWQAKSLKRSFICLQVGMELLR